MLVMMYLDADVPVIQLSIDATQPNSFHHEIGKRLAPLRDEDVFIMATGDVVHNLRTMKWDNSVTYDWASRFNNEVRNCLLQGDDARLIEYMQWGSDAQLSVPTPEHFLPLL